MAHDAVAARLRLALDFFATGEALMRQRLRRTRPESTPAEIEERIAIWLRERPGAEAGDAEGRPVNWVNRAG